MGFGQGIAQSFEIPMPQQQRMVAGGGAGRGPAKAEDYNLAALGLDKPAFDLQSTANVGERMQQYYADYADLVSFAKTMHKQYGIDVMAPDPRSEFSVRASEQFQKRLANLWHTQNAAKNAEHQLRSAQGAQLSGSASVQPGAFQQGQFFSAATPDQQTISNQLPEAFTLAGSSLNRSFDNQKDYQDALRRRDAFVGEVQRQFDQSPTEENFRRLQAAKVIKPTFNVEAAGKAKGGGSDFVRQHLEKVALVSKGSNLYFKPDPSGRVDSKGAPVRLSDQYKGQPFGYYDVVDKSGRKIKAQFVIDHLEHLPGEGGVFAVNENGEKVPFSEKGVMESMRTLGYVPAAQLYKFMEESGIADTSTADQFISEQNRITIPSQEALTATAGQTMEQREQITQEAGRGSNFWQTYIPFVPLASTSFKDASGNQVEIDTPEKGTAKLSGEQWRKVFGNTQDVIVDGKTITKTQAANGIPAQVMVRLLEDKGFITYNQGPQKGQTKKLSSGREVMFDGTQWVPK